MAGLALLALCLACDSSVAPSLTTWEGNLTPELPSTVGGQVAAVSQFGRTDASIQIVDGEPDVVYGWRINAGTCAQEGLIRGGVAAYGSLIPGEMGSASDDAVLDTVFRTGDQVAARVFRSDGGSGEVVVACGELEQTR